MQLWQDVSPKYASLSSRAVGTMNILAGTHADLSCFQTLHERWSKVLKISL